MFPMPVAKSQERESMSEEGVMWWKEYRVTQCRLGHTFRLESRYMAREGDKTYARVNGRLAMFTDPDTTWETWSEGDSPEAVIRAMLGDTDLFRGVSLSEVHAREVERVKQGIEADQRKQDLEARHRRAVDRLEVWKREQDNLFHKRHGHKAVADYDKARKQTAKRLKPEYDRLMGEVTAAKEAIQ